MQTFMKQSNADFRLDARSNLSVQCPDHKAIQSRGKRRRGRKRQRFVRYVPLKQFLGNSFHWYFFTDPTSGKRVFYRKVTLTLKTAGRVTVHAFHREFLATPKLILSRAFRLKPQPLKRFIGSINPAGELKKPIETSSNSLAYPNVNPIRPGWFRDSLA
jgi:hypothetical protein